MKKLMKKVNLGILIAAVMAIVTAAYVIITNVSFGSKNNELKEFITQYINDCCEANIGSREELVSSQKNVIAKYFSGYEGKFSGYRENNMMNANEITGILAFDYLDNGEIPGSVTDCKAEVGNVKCEKFGMNCAMLTVDVTMTITAKGSKALVCKCGVVDYVACPQDVKNPDIVFETTIPAEYIYILSPSGSSWLIDSVAMNENYSATSKTRVISGGISHDETMPYRKDEGVSDYE